MADAFAPVPVLRVPYFETEVVGPAMLDRLGAALFGAPGPPLDPAAVLHESLTQELAVDADGARLRLALPFAAKGELTLKQIGLELVVGVGSQRRTIMLPPPLAAMHPAGARFADGALEVSFE